MEKIEEGDMREIKFRAWDKNLKIMMPDFDNWIDFDGNYYERAQKTHDTPNIEIERCVTDVVLMQYTGLKDKNGKEIYEGDIVITDEAGWKAKIVFEGGMFVCVDNTTWGYSAFCNWKKFEIIGNIYENPELLNGQN